VILAGAVLPHRTSNMRRELLSELKDRPGKSSTLTIEASLERSRYTGAAASAFRCLYLLLSE
jgi:hypothetical protein